MDFHLDILLNLPNVTVFTCYQKEGFNILQLSLLNDKIKCNYCDNYREDIHQERPILVRDLSICGQEVYLLPGGKFIVNIVKNTRLKFWIF